MYRQTNKHVTLFQLDFFLVRMMMMMMMKKKEIEFGLYYPVEFEREYRKTKRNNEKKN